MGVVCGSGGCGMTIFHLNSQGIRVDANLCAFRVLQLFTHEAPMKAASEERVIIASDADGRIALE